MTRISSRAGKPIPRSIHAPNGDLADAGAGDVLTDKERRLEGFPLRRSRGERWSGNSLLRSLRTLISLESSLASRIATLLQYSAYNLIYTSSSRGIRGKSS